MFCVRFPVFVLYIFCVFLNFVCTRLSLVSLVIKCVSLVYSCSVAGCSPWHLGYLGEIVLYIFCLLHSFAAGFFFFLFLLSVIVCRGLLHFVLAGL